MVAAMGYSLYESRPCQNADVKFEVWLLKILQGVVAFFGFTECA